MNLVRPWTIAAGVWVGAVLLAVSPAGAQGTADPSELILRAAEQELEDVGGWFDYAFLRRVVRESFDADGAVTQREVLVFRCTPQGEGFDELLIEVDGATPSEREVRKNREAARFTRHLKMALAGSSDPDSHESFTAMLGGLEQHAWRHRGLEEVEGRQCHRYDMLPSPEPKGASLEERLAAAQVGTIWLEADTLHITRAELALSREVTAYGIIRLEKLAITSVHGPVPGGGWLPREIDVVSEVKVPFKRMRKRNHYRYSEFEKVGSVPRRE
jgi:hypothetical protein